ncbi:MAG: ribonuclease HII, partial [Patescibacteria group bacterium]
FWAPASARTKLIKLLGGRIRDSKQLSPLHRTEIYRSFTKFQKNREVNFAVCHISNLIIDKNGISHSVKMGIAKVLDKLDHKILTTEGNPKYIRLDGLLKAPDEYKNQKTIVKGDEKDVFIACASIIAKVCRDRLMRRLAKKYPRYAFDIHKGYGTKLHKKLIKTYGLCPVHRITFCKLT